MLRIGVIVVDADNVSRTAFPAVVADDRTCGVQRLREVIQTFYSVTVLTNRRQLGYAPRFVVRHPYHHARVAVVALDRFGPLLQRAANRRAREAVRGGHLLPHQETEPVSPVEIARMLDLLMLPHAVEAHGLRKLHVSTQRLIAGCCEQR